MAGKDKRFIVNCIGIVLMLVLTLASFPMEISATRLDDLRKEKEDAQKKLDAANSSVSNLNKEKDKIQEEISEIDAMLVDTMTNIALIEEQIDTLLGQIDEKKVELEQAIDTENNQYNAMKARIKLMYEKGEVGYVQVLLEAKSFADMLNRLDYVELLYDYDRTLLGKYQAAREAVELIKEQLEEQEAQLETDRHELEEEKAELDNLLEQKKSEAKDYESKIAKARQEAAAYKAKIKQQNAEIKKIEAEEAAKKAAEEAKKNAANKTNTSSQGSTAVSIGSGGSAAGRAIANYGCKFIGNPYVAGGTSLTNGADCSGFVYSVYKDCGYSIPRTGSAQRNIGRGVSYAEAQPGDIICYPGHVAIYIGNGQIVHASTPKGGIKIGSATYATIVTVRRVV